MQCCKPRCSQGLKSLCAEFLVFASSSPVPGSEGRDGTRELSWLRSAPQRWEQSQSKAVMNFYIVLCFSLLAGAGKGQAERGWPGHPCGLRKEPRPCVLAVRHLPCPRGHLRSPALGKCGFTTGEPQFALAASHLGKSIVFVSLALP